MFSVICVCRRETLTKRVTESLKTCESFCTLMTEMLKQNKKLQIASSRVQSVVFDKFGVLGEKQERALARCPGSC